MAELASRWLALAALALSLAGCGGDDGDQAASPSAPPPRQAPSATAPPGEGSTAPGAPATPSEDGAAPGGSQRVRVPATFTLRNGTLTPPTVSIPPFLAIEVSVAAAGQGAETVLIAADRPYRLRVPAGRRASLTLPGQPPGRYTVTAGRARAVLVVGGEPGP